MVLSRPPSSAKASTQNPRGRPVTRHSDHKRRSVRAERHSGELRPARGRAWPRGDPGAVRLRHGAQHVCIAHHSAGLRARRQRHMVRLSPRHRFDVAGRLLREPFCAPLRFAGIALHLHREHAAADLRRHRRMGTAACLSRHWRFGGRWSALLRHRAFPAVSPLGAARHSHACCGLRHRRDSSPIATSSFPPK